MSEKINELTPEQEKLMYQVKDEYIDLFNKTKEIDKPAFEKGIKWVYEVLMKAKMPEIVYCNSWYEALEKIAIQQIKDNEVDHILDDHNIKYNGQDLIETDGTVIEEFQPVIKNIIKSEFSHYSSYLNSYSNFGWVAFYDFFTKVGILDDYNFEEYKNLIKAGAFQVYEYDTHVFAVKPPLYIHKNEAGELSSVEGKAFAWEDGWGFYFINGFNISKELFEKLYNDKYTTEEFFREENEEVKSAVISFFQEKYGDEGVYRFFEKNLTLVDTYVDKKDPKYLEGTTNGMNIGVYSLFKGTIDESDIAYVRCYCPSTDRMFFLGVEPIQTNAKDAIASLFQVPTILKDKIQSVSRQGEKFSIKFDEQTNQKIKDGSYTKKDLSKYSSISGDEYFSLMGYEY